MSGYDIPDEAIDAADRIYGGQIPYDGLRQIIDAALPFILPGEIAEAEKRGAAKALAKANDDLLNLRDTLREKRGGSHTRWALGVEDAAGDVRVLARRIESGEVTL